MGKCSGNKTSGHFKGYPCAATPVIMWKGKYYCKNHVPTEEIIKENKQIKLMHEDLRCNLQEKLEEIIEYNGYSELADGFEQAIEIIQKKIKDCYDILPEDL